MAPSTVYQGVAGEPGEGPGMFTGMKFWLSRSVPQYARFAQDIIANGGQTCEVDKDADIVLYDHARKQHPPGAISYQFVEFSVRNGMLEDLEKHRIGVVQSRSERMVGSTATASKTTRRPFTQDEDRWLWNQVRRYRGMKGEAGNVIFKQLEELNPSHTYQSWRDRWLKRVQHYNWEEPLDTVEVAPQTNPQHQTAPTLKRKRQATTGGVQDGSERPLTAPAAKRRESSSDKRFTTKQKGARPSMTVLSGTRSKPDNLERFDNGDGVAGGKTKTQNLTSGSGHLRSRSRSNSQTRRSRSPSSATDASRSTVSDALLPEKVSREDFRELLMGLHMILDVPEDWMHPWESFAEHQPQHSATEWKEYFYRFVKPRYLQNEVDITMEEAEEEAEGQGPDPEIKNEDYQENGLEEKHEAHGLSDNQVGDGQRNGADQGTTNGIRDSQTPPRPTTMETLMPSSIPQLEKEMGQSRQPDDPHSQSSWQSHSTGCTIMPDVEAIPEPSSTPRRRQKQAEDLVLHPEIPETPEPESEPEAGPASTTATINAPKQPPRPAEQLEVNHSKEHNVAQQVDLAVAKTSPDLGTGPSTGRLDQEFASPSKRRGRPRKYPPTPGKPPPTPKRGRGRPRKVSVATSPLHLNLFDADAGDTSGVFTSSPPATDAQQDADPSASPILDFETAPDFSHLFRAKSDKDSDYVDDGSDSDAYSNSGGPSDSDIQNRLATPTDTEDNRGKGRRRQNRKEQDSLEEELNVAAQQERYYELARIPEVEENAVEEPQAETQVPETMPSPNYETAKEHRTMWSQSTLPSPLPTRGAARYLADDPKTLQREGSATESEVVPETSLPSQSQGLRRLPAPNHSQASQPMNLSVPATPSRQRKSLSPLLPGSPDLGSSVQRATSPPPFVPNSPDLGSSVAPLRHPLSPTPKQTDPAPQTSLAPHSSQSGSNSDSDADSASSTSTASTDSKISPNTYLLTRRALGWNMSTVCRILEATSGSKHRTTAVYPLVVQNGGELLEGLRGLWTERDDRELREGGEEGGERLRGKHGQGEVEYRRVYLNAKEEQSSGEED